MTIAIRQIHPVFVGEVSGVDISTPLSPDEVAARGGNITKPEDRRLQVGMNDVSNLGKDGRLLERDSRQRLFNLGNMLWHSDSSYRVIPAKYSLLSARVVNPIGGDTEYADMRAAYDALDAAAKAEIEDLVCEHSLMYSRGSLGQLDFTEEERAMFRPVRQRLVRTHPSTATQPTFVYVHTWRPWDFVMWDNRRTMHRVRRYDDKQPRDMRRTTLAGDAPTV